METIKKEITILNALNLVAYYKNIRSDQNNKDKFNVFSVMVQWNLKKNMNALSEATKSYEEFRTEKQQEINDKYFSDEYSDSTTIKKIVDGEEKEVAGRQVKPEFMQEYQKVNLQLAEELFRLTSEKVTVDIFPIDLEAEIMSIEKNSDNSSINLTMDDLDFLDFFK